MTLFSKHYLSIGILSLGLLAAPTTWAMETGEDDISSSPHARSGGNGVDTVGEQARAIARARAEAAARDKRKTELPVPPAKNFRPPKKKKN